MRTLLASLLPLALAASVSYAQGGGGAAGGGLSGGLPQGGGIPGSGNLPGGNLPGGGPLGPGLPGGGGGGGGQKGGGASGGTPPAPSAESAAFIQTNSALKEALGQVESRISLEITGALRSLQRAIR
jgi:hypothetical protein